MTLVLRDPEIERLVRFPEAVRAVRDGVVSGEGVAERSTVRAGGGWLRVISGALPGLDIAGYKAFMLVPGAGVRYLCVLYRLSSGEPLALVDGKRLTTIRTSAAAAAAASRHWGSERIDVGVIGSGALASDGLRALVSVCNVARVRVFSPRHERRRRYAELLGSQLGIDVAVADSAGEAAAGAAMVLCATQTRGTVALEAGDVDAGVGYISSVSSTLPEQRELDEHLLRGATVVIDTADALEESGDLLAARKVGFDPGRALSLASYLREGARTDGRVVFKSIGSMEQDLAIAHAAWEAAEAAGEGQRIEPIEALKTVPAGG